MNSSNARFFKRTIASPYLPLVAITIFGALLRFHNLGKEPLWTDEAATWRFAQLPLSQLWGEGAVRETNPPLYYTLQRFWLVFGQSEAALRSLSAIIGTITIPLLYCLGRLLGGHWLGLIASILLATSKTNIEYSQEARTYELLTMAATLALLGLTYLLTNLSKANIPIGQGLIRRLRRSDFNNQAKSHYLTSDLAWILYSVGISVALYCHNTAVLLFILANIITLVWWATKGHLSKSFFLNWSIANVIPILFWSWWIPKIIKQTEILKNFWIPTPTINSLLHTFFTLYSNKYYFLLNLGLAILGIWYWRHQPIKIIITITFSIGTILLVFLISLWRPIFITRILVWTIIPFLALVAAGLLFLRKKSLIAISLTILIIIQLQSIGNYYQNYKKEPWNQVASYVKSLVKSDDMILLFPSTIDAPFQYYFHPFQSKITQYGLRRWIFKIPRLPSTRVTEIQRSELSNIVQRFNRIWLVARNRKSEDQQDIVVSTINQNMGQVAYRSFNKSIEVFLFEKKQKQVK